ncbi:SDR family oxidoreductase [Mesorhizobium sp. LHD-90]|uniref:SDR family NAD(P)-dependent oxidoreductase n=1 Tax=Mesorhizobium sp. LHD-90 TaxID=3071414 RepID=UPI0027E13DEE|nr:SDR family oxidoreductase [Mesorhizobium sp. LHD-90]MDQ6434199.1 SDR family oxidoreductase [Mesorhizobium sp. LHD-90]
MSEFDGKVALITGTTGIGLATAKRLASAGANIVACGIDRKANAAMQADFERAGYAALVLETDVSVPQAVEDAVAQGVRRFGGLDIIVNSAAVHPYGTVLDTAFDTWNRAMAVNVGSIYLTGRFGIPEMVKRGGGAIVNVSSVQGFASQQNVAAYAATKGAIHALTRAMALDHARSGIRVNSVSPGSVRTPILENAVRVSDGKDADIAAAFKRFGDAHPIGRIGEPEELAELIAFLCSDRAGFCTGADYKADGGLTAGIGVR